MHHYPGFPAAQTTTYYNATCTSLFVGETNAQSLVKTLPVYMFVNKTILRLLYSTVQKSGVKDFSRFVPYNGIKSCFLTFRFFNWAQK